LKRQYLSSGLMKLEKMLFLLRYTISSRFSRDFMRIYRESLHRVNHPEDYHIDMPLHTRCARIAVESFKLQKGDAIPDIYQPGKMWNQILQSVVTYTRWNKEKDDSILIDALSRFYRTDLIIGHSGDAYIWDIQKGELDFRLQVYMILQRYQEFTHGSLHFDPQKVTTTDVGQNISVPYGTQYLTFKIIRHAYYLNRMKEFSLIGEEGTIIGELGTGAGELAILAKKLFPTVRYLCFDLPETLMVAMYNVLMSLPDAKVGLYSDFRERCRITREDLLQYDLILLPNWCIEWVDDDALDVCVNIGSLSEMDPSIIANYIRQIERICRNAFYTVNRNIEITEFGERDVPVSEFPFSQNVTRVHGMYDRASDMFHMRYGMDYACNYWEYVFRIT